MAETTEDRLHVLEKDHERVKTLLEEHVKSCDKRNDLILKMVVWAFIGIIVLVAEQTFNIHVPSNLPV